jgi:hypothetical protein
VEEEEEEEELEEKEAGRKVELLIAIVRLENHSSKRFLLS